mgnify:CR=1 FL=1
MIIENTLPTNHDKKPQTKNKQKIATDSKLENPNRELKALGLGVLLGLGIAGFKTRKSQ